MDGNALGTAAVVAAFLMPIISLIKKPTWSIEAKHILGMAAALIAAVVGAVVDGHVNTVQEFIPLFGTSFVSAQTLYTLYFSKTQMNATLGAVGGTPAANATGGFSLLKQEPLVRPLKAKGH